MDEAGVRRLEKHPNIITDKGPQGLRAENLAVEIRVQRVCLLVTVPFDRLIWNAQDCADYFKRPRPEFLRSIRWKPGFPKELPELPRHWRAVDVTNWALTGNPTISPESTQQAA